MTSCVIWLDLSRDVCGCSRHEVDDGVIHYGTGPLRSTCTRRTCGVSVRRTGLRQKAQGRRSCTRRTPASERSTRTWIPAVSGRPSLTLTVRPTTLRSCVVCSGVTVVTTAVSGPLRRIRCNDRACEQRVRRASDEELSPSCRRFQGSAVRHMRTVLLRICISQYVQNMCVKHMEWKHAGCCDRACWRTMVLDVSFVVYYSSDGNDEQDTYMFSVFLQCAALFQNLSYLRKIHRVSKNCANLFLSELRQISAKFEKFWQRNGKEAKIMRGALHSFSTSPNLRHHTTVLNADVPNCYTTLSLLVIDCSHLHQFDRGRHVI